MTDILFEYDHLLMRSEYRTPDPHSHLAVHLIAAVNGNLHCQIAGETLHTDAVFIASDICHTAFVHTGELLVFLFDTSSRYAKEINSAYLKDKPYCCLSKNETENIRHIWKQSNGDLLTADSAILDILHLKSAAEISEDKRITEILAFLKSLDEIPENIIPLLCAQVSLSKSRLSHLFSEKVGISLHRYLAMDKMRKGYIHYQKYGNITEAALRAGFNSPSHFASTCKRMFGISFSEFIKS